MIAVSMAKAMSASRGPDVPLKGDVSVDKFLQLTR